MSRACFWSKAVLLLKIFLSHTWHIEAVGPIFNVFSFDAVRAGPRFEPLTYPKQRQLYELIYLGVL